MKMSKVMIVVALIGAMFSIAGIEKDDACWATLLISILVGLFFAASIAVNNRLINLNNDLYERSN
jgi:hypothetical protein